MIHIQGNRHEIQLAKVKWSTESVLFFLFIYLFFFFLVIATISDGAFIYHRNISEGVGQL